MLLVPQAAAAASKLCFGLLFFLLCFVKIALFVLVASEPVLGGDFYGLFACFVFVALAVASLSGGHDLAAHCIHLASGTWSFFFPSSVFSCCSKYVSGCLLLLMFIFYQTPESGIPPSYRATSRYTKVHLGFCLRFSTLIGQIGSTD